MSDFQEKRISEKDARRSLRKANPIRQYGNTSGSTVPRFQYKASALVDSFALYVEEQMLYEPKSGKGCRVQAYHIEAAYLKLNTHIQEFLERERQTVALVKEALKQNKVEEE